MLLVSAMPSGAAPASGAAPTPVVKEVPCETKALLSAASRVKGEKPHLLKLAAKCTYTLTTAKTMQPGLLVKGKDLTIEGNGATIRWAGAAGKMFIGIFEGARVTMQDLTVSGGKEGGIWVGTLGGGGSKDKYPHLTLRNVHVTGNTSSSEGAGIYVYYGTLIAHDSRIDHNTSRSGGNACGAGVGISRRGHVVLSGTTTVTANTSYGEYLPNGRHDIYRGGLGGGICIHRGSLTMKDTATVTGNTAKPGTPPNPALDKIGETGLGGGIYNQGGTVFLEDQASITGNTAHKGGGIYNTSITFPGSPTGSGTDFNPNGGTHTGTVTLSGQAAVTGNTAYQGGGIYNDGSVKTTGSAKVENNTPSNCAGPAVTGCTG